MAVKPQTRMTIHKITRSMLFQQMKRGNPPAPKHHLPVGRCTVKGVHHAWFGETLIATHTAPTHTRTNNQRVLEPTIQSFAGSNPSS